MSQDCTSIGKAKSTYDSLNGLSGVSEGSINVSSNIDMEIAPGKKKKLNVSCTLFIPKWCQILLFLLTLDETFQVNLISFELCRYIIINMTIILKENILSTFLYFKV